MHWHTHTHTHTHTDTHTHTTHTHHTHTHTHTDTHTQTHSQTDKETDTIKLMNIHDWGTSRLDDHTLQKPKDCTNVHVRTKMDVQMWFKIEATWERTRPVQIISTDPLNTGRQIHRELYEVKLHNTASNKEWNHVSKSGSRPNWELPKY